MGHEIAGTIKSVPANQSYFKKNFQIALGADIEQNINFALGHEIDGGFQKYLKINKNLVRELSLYFQKKKKAIYLFLTELWHAVLMVLKNLLNQIKCFNTWIRSIGQLIAKLCLLYKSKNSF